MQLSGNTTRIEKLLHLLTWIMVNISIRASDNRFLYNLIEKVQQKRRLARINKLMTKDELGESEKNKLHALILLQELNESVKNIDAQIIKYNKIFYRTTIYIKEQSSHEEDLKRAIENTFYRAINHLELCYLCALKDSCSLIEERKNNKKKCITFKFE